MNNLSNDEINLLKKKIVSYEDFKHYIPNAEDLKDADHNQIMALLRKRSFYDDVVLEDDAQVFLVNRGNKEEILTMFSVVSDWNHATEEAIVKCGDDEIILAYLRQHRLHSKEARQLLIELSTEQSVVALIDRLLFVLDDDLQEMIINKKMLRCFFAHIKHHNLSIGAEVALMSSDLTHPALVYITRNSLSEAGEKAMLNNAKMKEVAGFYIDRTRLSEAGEALMIDIGSLQLIKRYIDRHPLGAQAMKKLIAQHEHLTALLSYVQKHEIPAEAMEDFVTSERVIAASRYFEHHHLTNFRHQEALAARGLKEMVMTYIGYYYLDDSAECLLLDRGWPDVISFYLKRNGHFFADAEEKWLPNARHEDVMEVVKRHELCFSAEMMLIERGNSEEIKTYISNHYLYDRDAREKLLERGVKEEIDIFVERYYPKIADNNA